MKQLPGFYPSFIDFSLCGLSEIVETCETIAMKTRVTVRDRGRFYIGEIGWFSAREAKKARGNLRFRNFFGLNDKEKKALIEKIERKVEP